ncbi:MAG: DUF86 domain-containing protein [Nitrososphaeria archaeon]|nr:DUF86 domain-containing protein [Nitrososphaeria archaeon]
MDAISNIEKFTKGLKIEKFFENVKKQYAILRGLEIIDEASKHAISKLKARRKEIPWKDIAGIRDKLIHGYFDVNLELVWETIRREIRELKKQISQILEGVQIEEN